MLERREILFDPPARHFFERIASSFEQRAIGDIVRAIADNPYVDNDVKFDFEYPPTGAVVCKDPQFWVVYEILGPHSILVLSIGFASEPPHVPQ